MDRRLQAGLACVGVAGLTAAVAVLTANSPTPPTIDPTSVTLVGINAEQIEATFVVRGAGCPAPPGTKDRSGRIVKSPTQRVKHPSVQYTAHTVDVGFRVEDPGPWRCTGPDPGVLYWLVLPLSLGDRTLRNADQNPPQPFPLESATNRNPAPSPTPGPARPGPSPSPAPIRTP
jgi:hypothetical protein